MNPAVIAAVGLLALALLSKKTSADSTVSENPRMSTPMPRIPSRPVFKDQRTGGMRPGEAGVKMISDRGADMPDKPLSQQQEGMARKGRM